LGCNSIGSGGDEASVLGVLMHYEVGSEGVDGVLRFAREARVKEKAEAREMVEREKRRARGSIEKRRSMASVEKRASTLTEGIVGPLMALVSGSRKGSQVECEVVRDDGRNAAVGLINDAMGGVGRGVLDRVFGNS
jgi:hypothetical protein